ncbi:MAG: flavodoxin domain-containing protein [Candidatus Omnitrophota bacterium]|jgi:flavorubredoxin
MKTQQIKEDIYWAGVIDWSVRNFHGHTYTTGRGTTYNAYLMLDKKVALVDTVYGPFASEFIENIRAVIDPARIDYIIANHVETDHSGALPEVLKLCPKAKVVGTQKCKEGLYKHYYCDMDFQVVKTGDTISLGKKTLTFIEAPMIHWPDSMFTYCPEEKLLMPNDAFGQHYAAAERFDDEVPESILMDEAVKYYANILWPLGSIILKKIEEVQKLKLPIDMIAPSHGIIWRGDPGKIVNAYVSWAKQETKPRVVIVYETMWGATERMARLMVKGLIDTGVDAGLFDINRADRTDIIKEMLGAKAFMFGSSTHDNGMLPNIAGFLESLKGLKPKNRIACAFGSFGWGGGAVANIEKVIAESGIEISQPALACKYMPDKEEISRCYEFGKAFGAKVLSG